MAVSSALATSFTDAFTVGWRHRRLIDRLARRDISARYRGSLFGPLWAVAVPLLTLAVYNFAFGSVLQARVTEREGRHIPFVLLLFVGLLLFQILTEMVQSSPSLIRNNATFVKQVVFPLEILPRVTLAVALFNATVSFAILLVFHCILLGAPPLGVLWIPLIALPLVFLALGAGWALSAIGVYFRDLTQIAGLICTSLMFLSPIFYSLDAAPASARVFIELNPITTIVTEAREALFESATPNFVALGLCLAGSLVVFVAGFAIFQRLRPAFADVV